MSRHQAQALVAAALLGTLATAPVHAQRQPQRNPIFVVTAFRSVGEPKLGLEAAAGVRDRMSKLFPQPPRAGAMRVIKLEEINAQLSAASFPTDSAITTSDLQNLGRQIGATESMEGTVVRTAVGVKLTARFYSLSNTLVYEVLPPVEDRDVGGAARKLADLYAKAREELPDYERCRSGVIYGEAPQAIVAANAAIKKWDKGILPLACLMAAYQIEVAANHLPIDSIIRVGQAILQVDPDNENAMVGLVSAYRAQANTDRAMRLSLRLYEMHPDDANHARNIIDDLLRSGAPDRALPIAQQVLAANPGDPDLIAMVWNLQFRLKQWPEAIATGRELVRFDSSRADTAYFRRQIAIAHADSQPVLVLSFLALATSKFSRDARLLLMYSQELRKAGQLAEALDAAKRARVADPKVEGVDATILYLMVNLGQRDSAIAFSKRALAEGADSATIADGLLTLVTPLQKTAQASNARGDWEAMLAVAGAVDSAAPSIGSKFFFGVSAASIAFNALTNVSELQTKDRVKACAELKVVEAMLPIAETYVYDGRRYSTDIAGSILRTIAEQKPNLPQYRRAVCPRPDP